MQRPLDNMRSEPVDGGSGVPRPAPVALREFAVRAEFFYLVLRHAFFHPVECTGRHFAEELEALESGITRMGSLVSRQSPEQ